MNLNNYFILSVALISSLDINSVRCMKESWLNRRYKKVYPEMVWQFYHRDWNQHHEDVHKAQWPQLFDLFIDGWIPKKKWVKKNRNQLDEIVGTISRKLNGEKEEMLRRRRWERYRRSHVENN